VVADSAVSNVQRARLEKLWLPTLLICVVAALVLHDPLLLAASLVGITTGLVTLGWRARALHHVVYARQIDPTRLFPGEQCSLLVTIENRKLLPVPWMTVTDVVPSGLRPVERRQRHGSIRDIPWKQSYAPGPYQRLERRLELTSERRGLFTLPPVTVHTGDPFALFTTTAVLGTAHTLVVYPRLLPAWSWAPTAARPFGEGRAQPPSLDDPLQVTGTRDYVPGDPQRRIHWKATARGTTLKSRVYEPSANLALTIVLDGRTSDRSWDGVEHETLERGIELAATAARDALDARVPVGLLSNMLLAGSDQRLQIPIGRSGEQLSTILESLAALVPFFAPPLADVLETHLPVLPFGASLLVVSAVMTDELHAILDLCRRRGHPVILADPRDVADV